MPFKIVIGFYNHILAEGLKKLLADDKGFKVLGVFNEVRDLQEIVKLAPDLLILDSIVFNEWIEAKLPDLDVKTLLIGEKNLYTAFEKKGAAFLAKGVVGILPPASTTELLKKAIKAVAAGELWLDRKTMSKIITTDKAPDKNEINLTKTEREIVSLLCEGYRNKEIAVKLNIAEQTVKSHCNRAFKKAGVTDRLQLAVQAYKLWPEMVLSPHKIFDP
jgi:DNA-binding NarL/FixJ family response regulator